MKSLNRSTPEVLIKRSSGGQPAVNRLSSIVCCEMDSISISGAVVTVVEVAVELLESLRDGEEGGECGMMD